MVAWKKDRVNDSMPCKHFDCLYFSPQTETCDYILITGESRKCRSDKCDKYTIDPKEINAASKGYKPRTVDRAALARLDKAYSKDKTMEDMAKESGVNLDLVSMWARKVHPECASKYSNSWRCWWEKR